MRLSRQFLANIATAASVAGLFLAYAGVIVTFYGIKGETDLDFLGRTFESANVGVALIALGAALILLNVHRISKRFVAAIVVGPVSYAHAKIVNAHLTQMIKREKLNFDEIRRPTTKESETVGLASKELEQETSPGEVYESSLAEHDASDESEEQIQSHLRTPDEVVPLPAKTVLRNDADLKILSSVPDPGLFVGREAELERLQVFFEGRGHHLAVLIGSEGIGKTALVARAVHECVKDLSLVFWHRFSEEERPTLDTLFLKLRTFFQGRGDQSLTGLLENPVATTRDKVDAVATALTKQNYSLIFDDLHLLFDRRHQIQHPGLYRFFAQLLQGGYPGLVVLVSRIEPVFEGWLVGAEAKVKLGRPEQEVSHELLRSLGYPSESRETLQRMHELALGNPGEMLLLAGLADSHVLDSLGDAGNRLDDFQDRLLELVAQQLEEAERGLLLVAITHQEPIPEEVFRYHLGERPEAILEPLRRLVERCVLSYDEKNETYRLHGLLRRYLVDTLEREAQVKTHAEAARYYERLPCSEDPTSYDRVLGQVEASYHFFRAGQYAEAAPFQLSQHFLGWGLHELHLEMWQRVSDHLEGKSLSTCYNQMGLIYRAQREYDEALEYFLETERIGKETQDRVSLGPTYNNIGEIYRVRGEHEKALDYYLKSEQIREEVGDRAGLGPIYNNIGLIKYSQGAYEEAQDYLERSYEILCQFSAHAESEQVRENLDLLVAQQHAQASLSEPGSR